MLEGYEAVRERCGIIARPDCSFLRLTGTDVIPWLQGMVSNDVRPLSEPGVRIPAFILDSTGHIQAEVICLSQPAGLLLSMRHRRVSVVRDLLERYLITEDVLVSNASSHLCQIQVLGPNTEAILTNCNADLGSEVQPYLNSGFGSGGVDLILPEARWQETVEMLRTAGAELVSEEASEALRIEAGVPLDGVDMDERTIANETGLVETHVSETKGCYVGQEIVARILARGHTNRALTGFLLGKAVGDFVDSRVDSNEHEPREVGWITSQSWSPYLKQNIALGYLRHEFREPGTMVTIGGTVTAQAVVAELPFYRF